MKTMDRAELEQLRARVLRDDHCQDDVFALIDELIEARRVGASMCSLAHNLTTVLGNAEYSAIVEARKRLEGKNP